MIPLPRYLKDILKPIGNNNNEFELIGKIACSCGSETFTIGLLGDDSGYVKNRVIVVIEDDGNYFLKVTVKCNFCRKEHLIFDNTLHGWDGFVCNTDDENKPKPNTKDWSCNKCGCKNHSLTVKINSQGQADFISGAGDTFDKSDWAEAFDWITIGVECKSCDEKNEEWISYETM